MPFPEVEAALGVWGKSTALELGDLGTTQLQAPICAALGKSPDLSESVSHLSHAGKDWTGDELDRSCPHRACGGWGGPREVQLSCRGGAGQGNGATGYPGPRISQQGPGP